MKTLEAVIDSLIWKIMVGCATGQMVPGEKDEQIQAIASAVRGWHTSQMVKVLEGLKEKADWMVNENSLADAQGAVAQGAVLTLEIQQEIDRIKKEIACC